MKYSKLSFYLKKQHQYPVSVRKNYTVITVPNTKYHITIFQDQWDNYQSVSKKRYHLFHISSDQEDNRCSSYFWVDKNNYRIQKIPKKYFSYQQSNYSFFSSTRKPCNLKNIIKHLVIFQRLLKQISNQNVKK